MYWGIHNSFVYKFVADVEYNIKVRYRTPYRIYLLKIASKSNPRLNDWEGQSLMILQLPEYVEFKSITVDQEFALNCEDKWLAFPKLDIDLELEADKTILFIYNVALPLVDKEMSVAIFIDNLINVILSNFRKSLFRHIAQRCISKLLVIYRYLLQRENIKCS
jgi:hypothetical protein